ncbi:polysaccharide deacetylase family protein [Magnetovibrio sp. PR-2]|uniref:polysaccharide deacetylase family protein n=1 Tax=Magnetovibrio sp. PR-2 TaxID=3120356 RepID=UPI002FCDE76A
MATKLDPSDLTDQKALSVIYHYSHPREGYDFPGLHGVESPIFAKHVQGLKEHFEMVDCSDLMDKPSQSGRLKACITFDDGIVDVERYVRPTLKAEGVPAIVFCCSQPLMEGKVLNVQKIHLMISKLGFDQFSKEFQSVADTHGYDLARDRQDISHLGLRGSHRFDNKTVGDFKRMINFELRYDVLDHILEVMFATHFGDERDVSKRLYMSLDDMRRCQDDGIEIGLHTHSHRLLSRLDRAGQDEEIRVCLNYFKHHLDLKNVHIAYPFGVYGVWNEDTVDIMTDLGLRSGHALHPKSISEKELDENWAIPRYVTNDLFDVDGNFTQNSFETLKTLRPLSS